MGLELLDAALTLHDENPRFANGVGNMLCADSGIENVACLQNGAVFDAALAIPHLDPTIENGEDLFTIIDMPFVWLICPMKTRSNAIHVGDVGGAPWAIGFECACAEYFHATSNAEFRHAAGRRG
jgi:hypothetical protein